MQLFPAVLIGGPPHSGKSVLAYSLSLALRQRGVEHYVLRAYPDGEGDWANEAEQALVRRIRFKDSATPSWVDNICRDIARRHLPLIVDVGGRPTPWQEAIFAQCTHAILLSPAQARVETGQPAALWWQALLERHGVPLLAQFESCLGQPSRVTTHDPILQGRLSDLQRGAMAAGAGFSALVDLLAGLFAYNASELRSAHVAAAPFDLVIELNRLAQTLGLNEPRPQWSPSHLPRLLDYLPADAPLALYDRGPNWIYAAVSNHNRPAPFYQFDARLGWVEPPAVALGPAPEDNPVTAVSFPQGDFQRLEIWLRASYLDYADAAGALLPPLPAGAGLVVSGKLPLWFWSAIARAYAGAHWLAVYQPQLQHQAVVVASNDRTGHPVGSLVQSPSPLSNGCQPA